MPVNDTVIRTAKPRDRAWKLHDEKGLYLLITPTGSKLWRVKFRRLGREKKLSLGAYPAISLKAARQLRDDARRALAEGKDPAAQKSAAKAAAKLGAEHRFELIAEEFISKRAQEGLAESTITKARWFLELLRPSVGKLPISEITPQQLLGALKKVEAGGHRETARRLRSFASRVFRYGVATSRCHHDPAQALRGALIAPVARHYGAITDRAELGRLLRAIEVYSGEPATRYALCLTAHVFQRPGEIRHMRWADVDWDRAIWTIPAPQTKQRREHVVPLSRQSLTILGGIRSLTGRGIFVFPSLRSKDRPMSENAINAALRRLGYTGSEMTAHGFRSTASSLLNESGFWSPDAIERALAHQDGNQVRAAYHRASYWDERLRMAQWWSDYLDDLSANSDVVRVGSRPM